VTGGTTASRTYKPNANFAGKDSFYFSSNVGCHASPPAKVLITVIQVNDAPVLAKIGNRTVKVSTAMTFTATATDVDAGQTKTFSLIGAPSGATISATTGVFKWTPPAVGSYIFKVRVTDNGSPVLFDEEQDTIKVTTTGTFTLNRGDMYAEEIHVNRPPSIYPNPADSRFYVRLDESPEKISATITDMKGALIKNWSYRNADQGKLDFDIGKLSRGQYILRLNAGDKSWSLKFVKL
jgi:hypothetical protein